MRYLAQVEEVVAQNKIDNAALNATQSGGMDSFHNAFLEKTSKPRGSAEYC